ncbi:hypothetical protein V5799_027751 [Amblyomma americanum]|uniref:M13 family peptidase n=1 Tax=Amblyomma americanum TaxID=6943 RepID=A0AAQ4DEU2_AMBAM
MDPDVDPCDNFFDHVCGRWGWSHPLALSTGQLLVLQMRVLSAILHEIERPPTHSVPAVRKSVSAYQACLSVYEEGREDTKVLFDVFKQFKFEWPSLSLPADFNVVDFLLGLSLEYNLPTPLLVHLQPHLKTDKRYGLSLDFQVYSEIETYFDHLTIERCLPNVAPSLGSSDVAAVVERINKVYSDIDTTFTNLFQDNRITRLYATVKSVANESGKVATLETWLKVINSHLPKDRQITEDEDLLTFNNIGPLIRETLSKTEHSGYVDLVLFAGWNILGLYHVGVSYALGDCLNTLSVLATFNTAFTCINLVDKVGVFAMARLLLDTLELSRAVQATHSTWDAVRNATQESFPQLSWMDKKTVAGSVQHVDSVIPVMPLPAHLNTSDALEAFHDYLPTPSSKSFIEWLLEAFHQRSEKYKRLLREDPNVIVHREDFFPSSIGVNAFYVPLTHIMGVAGAIMAPPFVSPNMPRAVDHGAIGKVLGHELTHAFDPLFSELTRTGEVAAWWSKESFKNLAARLECLENQLATYTGDRKHAKSALSEAFADSAGTEKARLTFGSLPPGPGILGYTQEQLFFVAGCFEFCTDEGYSYEQNGLYPAVVLRCNQPVSNEKRFAQAFKCAEGAALNPRDRCSFH